MTGWYQVPQVAVGQVCGALVGYGAGGVNVATAAHWITSSSVPRRFEPVNRSGA